MLGPGAICAKIAGRSTLARAVSLELGNAPLVDKDDARDALAEVFSEREDDDEEEGEEEEEEREQGRKKKTRV